MVHRLDGSHGKQNRDQARSAAFTDASKTRYVSPGVGCAKNHIIYLANGKPADNDNNALGLLRRLNPSAVPYTHSGCRGRRQQRRGQLDRRIRCLLQSWRRPGHARSKVHRTSLCTRLPSPALRATAITRTSSAGLPKEGGGLYQQASNSDEIVVGLTKILNQMRAANSVFASASLPVSANTQGTYLNQVYIGMFRPDGNALPRWVGNLKQYQFVYNASTNTLKLADATLTAGSQPDDGLHRQRCNKLLDDIFKLLAKR